MALGGRILPGLMKENGVKVLNEANLLTFNTGDIDVSAQVTTIRSLNPDGVIVAADSTQAVTVIRELKRQGVLKPVIGGTPLIAAATLKAAPEIPSSRRERSSIPDGGRDAHGQVRRLAAAAAAQGPGLPAEIEPSMYDANIYEIVTLYLDAVRKTGVTLKPGELAQDREKIRSSWKRDHSRDLPARFRSTRTVKQPSLSSSLSARTAGGPKEPVAAARLEAKAAERRKAGARSSG